MITKDKLLELLIKTIPYPDQIKDIDTSVEDAVYFTWRSDRYKATCNPLEVMTSNKTLLKCNDASILMTECLTSCGFVLLPIK